MNMGPLNEGIAIALGNMVDDASGTLRYPSHSDLDGLTKRAELWLADPKSQNQVVGKRKRIQAVLRYAIDNAPERGRRLVYLLLASVRANGGFRVDSTNFVGREVIVNLAQLFRTEGYVLSTDGEIYPLVLDGLPDKDVTEVLRSYVRRAQRGAEDAGLLLGTAKDLMESVARHVLFIKTGQTQFRQDFPTLLGQAFIQLDMKTPQHKKVPSEPVMADYERSLYDMAIALNRIRNKEGTGHGRLFLPSVGDAAARNAIQCMGVISGYMLDRLLSV